MTKAHIPAHPREGGDPATRRSVPLQSGGTGPHPELVEGRGPRGATNLGDVPPPPRTSGPIHLPHFVVEATSSCVAVLASTAKRGRWRAAKSRDGGGQSHQPTPHNQAGFSLIETLVALAALSILAGAGMMMTDFAITARETVATRDAEATDLLRLRAALKADLTQAAPRRARDQSGRKPQTALLGSAQLTNNAFLALTRRGWENPTGEGRASLQYVEYVFRDGAIERRHRRHIDGADTETPQILINNIRDVAIAYMQHDQWLQNWAGSASIPLPDAVRIDITFTDDAELSQLFLLPEVTR